MRKTADFWDIPSLRGADDAELLLSCAHLAGLCPPQRADVREDKEMASTTALRSQSDIWWVFLLEGIASIIFGFLLITRPAETLVALVIFLGLYWLFVGV
ncbi:MAG: DUF308 domain-containing protein, partial [Methyloceanibacter sp.]